MAQSAEEEFDFEEYVNKPEIKCEVKYNTRDLILYACGIGSQDPRFVYENHPDFAAFPTYPICLMYKGDLEGVLGFPTKFEQFWGSFLPRDMPPGYKVGLDAEKYIERVNEIPRDGAALFMRGRLQGVAKKATGALTEMLWELVDADGKVYYKMLGRSFLVGCHSFKGAGKMEIPDPPAPKGAPTMTVEVPTHPGIANIFRLSGDYNPMHVDPRWASALGFEQPILQGLCTFGHSVEAVLGAVAGGDQKRYKSVQCRFSSLVYAGDLLLVEIWTLSPTQVAFQTVNQRSGKVCVSHGVLTLHPEAKL